MGHNEIYIKFKKMMPMYGDRVATWFPNGRNSIRVRLTNKEEFIFTLLPDNGWRFETLDSFLKTMEGERKMR